VAPDSLEVYIGKVRRLSVAAAPKRQTLETIETRNFELRDALHALEAGATPARHRRVAEAYRSAGVLDQAYDHFVAARNLDSRDAAAYEGLARIWREWGSPHLGVGDASRAVYYAPRSAAARNTLGTLLHMTGQPAQARRAFERALALDPGAAYAWTNLCYQSFLAGAFEAAAGECRRALDIDPGLADAHNDLALVYAAAGEMRMAEAEFAAAGTGDAACHYNVGIVLSAWRRYAEAAESFEAAERLRPGWTDAGDRARQARRRTE
jgi:tetratricopeptide (TPR) repeat protein